MQIFLPYIAAYPESFTSAWRNRLFHVGESSQ
jgi:hypothetical protein